MVPFGAFFDVLAASVGVFVCFSAKTAPDASLTGQLSRPKAPLACGYTGPAASGYIGNARAPAAMAARAASISSHPDSVALAGTMATAVATTTSARLVSNTLAWPLSA